MRWNAILLLFLSFSCFGQDSIRHETMQIVAVNYGPPEWAGVKYTQEDKIYNRSVWTFADNPALAGFDRKLAIAYRYQMKNLSMGVPNDDGNLELAFMKHEAFIDYGFGGKRKNWGIGLYYNNEKELQHTYHRTSLSTSYRILIQHHSIILGLGAGVQFSKLEDWQSLTFSDMIDPRHGFIYPTQEVEPSNKRLVTFISCGLRYNWNRLFFSYAFQSGPNGALALAGYPTSMMHNKLRTGYHILVEDDLTITPEFVANISTSYYNKEVSKGIRIATASNNYPLFSGYITFTYKDIAYGQLGIVNHSRMALRFGYQLRDLLIIHIGTSGYFVEKMMEIGGWASVEAGIRVQFNTSKK